jgi:hypothetical protein
MTGGWIPACTGMIGEALRMTERVRMTKEKLKVRV